jgi:WD40 repeat protein
VAYESGIITFFSTTTAAPIYIFDAHTSAVTQMVWDSKLKVLITSSKDKTLKIWKLPDKWTLLAGKTEEKPVKPIEPTATSSSTKSAEVKKKNDSDSDSDLEGWND